MWPGSYMFKIQKFSLLSEFARMSNNMVQCFDSPEFESDGHKWSVTLLLILCNEYSCVLLSVSLPSHMCRSLSIYPNGNKKQGVEDHVSAYLVAADADIDSIETGINVTFKMFVYDHFHDNFLTIQEPYLGYGFPKFISFSDLKDKARGFILNDYSLIAEVEVNLISKDAGGGGAAPAAAEVKKEDKVEEKEESNDDMGFSLFD
ncbi:hypothetical protein QQ045_011000 [Rhodiola kirilowii]